MSTKVAHAANGKSILAKNKRAAKSAGLNYISDEVPGIHRKRNGHGFFYENARGKKIHDAATLHRIAHLAIPPAYKDVWICPNPRGHIQAVGRDDRGRKQYKYHEQWRQVRDENKYGRMTAFAKVLPTIRRKVQRDLKLPGLSRRKVLAAVVKFMELTLMRVGNDEYAKNNHSFGLTTLQDRHARISRGKVHFEFRGKSGVEHEFDISDPRLAKIAKRCQDLPGQELFQYLNEEGKVCDVGSSDVNEYLREISGADFTAKDFRTWAGTVLAAVALSELEKSNSQTQAKKNIVKAVEVVAQKLGNTRAVCRKCYIHPAVFASYLDGHLAKAAVRRIPRLTRGSKGLRADETVVLNILQRRLTSE